jgi:autotransporter adhesin
MLIRGGSMKRKINNRLSFLAAFTFLAISALVPVCGYAEADTNQSTTTTSSSSAAIGGNTVSSTGASISNGNQNTAVGTSVVITNGSNNEISDIGAFSGVGNGNTAIGFDSQIIDGNNNKVVGFGAQAGGGNYNTAIGRQTSAINGDGNTAIGSQSYAGGTASSASILNTAIGYGAQATTGNSVALGAYSIADRPNSVSVGSYGYERQITNVAPGIYDTDAVNMSQLRGVDNKVNRVGATAFAFSALAPLPYDPKEPTQYSAGIGTYNGTGAIAVGVYHYTKPDVMLNAAVGMSNNGWERSARFGISWRTGGPKQKELIPAILPTGKKDVIDRVKKILDDGEKAE